MEAGVAVRRRREDLRINRHSAWLSVEVSLTASAGKSLQRTANQNVGSALAA